MVRSPWGMTKARGMARVVARVLKNVDPPRLWDAARVELPPELPGDDLAEEEYDYSLEGAHRLFREQWCVGGFTAYELVTDLRHTILLRDAVDVDTWCHLGPGATRGLGRVFGGDVERFSQQRDQAEMLTLARRLLAHSRSARYWPAEWPRWEMREVEHWLCEVSKYNVALEGGRMKRRYRR